MDSKLPPHVGRAWRLIRRVVHFGPRCINRLVCSRGSSERVILWGLTLRVVNVPGGDSERIGSGKHQGKCRGWECPEPVTAFPCWARWWAVLSGPETFSHIIWVPKANLAP
ncbi:hypothetical protein AVEN_265919-1 [Araneus ventricosus]|uniref:Uncharacterized protein n=1 Tax=Araneus ventricosus TaxID=182803 RepID=A0A4Y2MES1_ARAVE|nr:hypothetical protein AVEN_265919-1 [Araneus ventricosus]